MFHFLFCIPGYFASQDILHLRIFCISGYFAAKRAERGIMPKKGEISCFISING